MNAQIKLNMNIDDITNNLLNHWFAGLDISKKDIYLVGGSVRDLLIDRYAKDIDLVCKDAKKLAYEIAIRRDAAVVPMEKKPNEPCYRVVDRNDTSSYIDIAELRGQTIVADLMQRDFTINAIAMKITGNFSADDIIDPLGGMEHIKNQTIRMTCPRAFTADPLRILRAVRLKTHLGFKIDRETLQCMHDSSGLLSLVPTERIMAEMFMVFEHHEGSKAFRMMDEIGILDTIFPEALPMKGCQQNGYHHLDVWGHSLLVMENVEMILNGLETYFGSYAGTVKETIGHKRTELLKLAALFHDIGKPAVKGYNQDKGRITFHGHEKTGASILQKMFGSLKMSGNDSGFILKLVENHLRPIMLYSPKASDAAKMRWFRKMGDLSVAALILSMADVISSKGPESGEQYRHGFVKWASETCIDYLQNIKSRLEAAPLITGYDLIAAGMKPGPGLGQVLKRIREAQDIGRISTREEAMKLANEYMS